MSMIDSIGYNPFHINHSGIITLVSSLISASVYRMNVTVCDISFHFYPSIPLTLHSGIPILCSSRIIPITVLSVFSNPLCYPEYISVSEHSPVNTFIGVYSAEDLDGSILHYSIESNDFVAINPLSGSLFLKEDVDYETTVNATYSFCYHIMSRIILPVHVEKLINNTYCCDSFIHLQILDIPEKPIFDPSNNWSQSEKKNVISVSEQTTEGTILGSKLRYIDPDVNDMIVYSLSCINSPLPCPFNISQDGFVRLAHSDYFDYEIQPKWILRIVITDSYGLFSEMTLIVNLLDVNEAPFFSQNTLYRVGTLPLVSNEVIGLPITAQDPENDILIFSINSSLFSIDSLGQIRLVDITINPWIIYNTTVTVTDPYGLTDTAFVIISFYGEEVSFSVKHTMISLLESNPVGSVLLPPVTVTGIYSSPLHFELVSGSEGVFTVNSTSGIISQLHPLDYETRSSFSLSVLVTDQFDRQASGIITIMVEDVNEQPVIQQSSCSALRSISEKSPVNTFISPPLIAVDPDLNDSITYSLVKLHEEDPTLPITVDPILGTLFVSNSSLLDHDDHDHYEMMAVVTDSKGLNDSCLIHLDVRRENRKPSIEFIQKDIYVSEDVLLNSMLSIPSLIRDENQDQLTFSSSCIGSPLHCPFNSTGSSMDLIVIDQLDYENTTTYVVEICVSDVEFLMECENVTVHVVDVDEPPVLFIANTTVVINEDDPIGTIITTIVATDPEGGDVHYSISGDNRVTIDSESGELMITGNLNSETTPLLNVTVTVTDNTGHSSSQPITIIVNEVNQAPVCGCFWNAPFMVYENLTVGSLVTVVNVTDREVLAGKQTLSLMLLSEMSTFQVQNDGSIYLLSPLNYWNQSDYTLQIRVEDNGIPSMSTLCSVSIHVMDINTAPILHIPSSVIHIAENHTVFELIPTGLRIEDEDYGQTNYFFVLNSSVFGVDPISGELYHRDPLDYETQNLYSITIGARDISESPQSTSIQVTIIVDDVNEPPILLSNSFVVSEAAAIHSLIGVIRYSDPDQGVNGVVRCIQRNNQDVFILNENTCSVKLKQQLDYEQQSGYLLSIVLVDGGGLMTNGIISITVLDVNEPPVILCLTPTVSITSETEIGSIIGSPFTVIDPENDPIVVTVVSSSMNMSLIVTSTELNQYMLLLNSTTPPQGTTQFTITATDSHGLSTSGTTNVFVAAPQEEPILTPLVCSIPEHTPIHSVIENCSLSLVNQESFSSVLFSKVFSVASSEFGIVMSDNKTALIKVFEDTDYETMNHFVIPVVFTAMSIVDQKEVTGNGFVVINLLDINEAPFFVSNPHVIEVDEGLPVNSVLSPCFQAVDPDENDKNYSPVFALVTVNDWFGIQVSTGCLYLKQDGLDYENSTHPKSLLLRIMCSDRHGASSETLVTIMVRDVNEPPSFLSDAFFFSINSPVSLHSIIGPSLTVFDPDENPGLTYHIQHQSCENAFVVNPTAPLLSTGNESVPEFTLMSSANHTCIVHLQVIDKGGLTDSTIVYVTIVSNVVLPTIPSTIFSVNENPVVNQVIGSLTAQSNCGSVDELNIEFFMMDSPFSSYVSIHNDHSLRVLDPSIFDFETRESIKLLITAVDHGCFNISTSIPITILITDVNEPPIVHNITYHVNEGMTYPLQLSPPVTAIDPEGSPVVFSVLTLHPLLSIDNNGVITLQGHLIHSSSTTHRFIFSLSATDNGVPPLSSIFTVTIEYDQSQSPWPSFTPIFVDGKSLSLHIPESQSVGSLLGSPLNVTTGNAVNPILFFSIESCSPFCPVVIHSTLGQLSLSAGLDFEQVPIFMVNVTVTNGVAMDWIQIQLIVLDEEDCQISSILPQMLNITDTTVSVEGLNLSPIGIDRISSELSGSLVTGTQFNVSYVMKGIIRDQTDSIMSEILLRDCQIRSFGHSISCILPASLGYSIQWVIEWKSTIDNSILHHCSFLSRSTSHFKGVNVTEISGVTQMSTTGARVCFSGEHMGTASLYNAIPQRNAITASATLVDASNTLLSSCSYSTSNDICCNINNGYGSTIIWELCLYGHCSSIQNGEFQIPSITSITTSKELNSLGGDSIVFTGMNFGSNMNVTHVYMMKGGEMKELRDCHFIQTHQKLECRSIEGSGDQLTFVVKVADQQSSPFVSSLSYSIPIITSMYGPGTQNALTSGGQVIFVAGQNLGIEENSSILHYGDSNEKTFITSPCHVLLPHTLLRCVSVPGSGYQNRWLLRVGGQFSNEYYQSKSIYGYPIVISVDKLNTPLPTTGGLVLMIDGLNYGTNNSQVVVEYVNEKGITYSPSCQLTINHTQLTCTTVPGYGNRLSWSIEVNGLLSVDLFVMSYAKPSIDSLTCKNMNCGRLTGGEVVILTGSNLGPSSSPVQATYGFSGLEFTARNCHIISNSAIECTTAAGVGQNLKWIVWIGEQQAECGASVEFSYFTTTISYSLNTPITIKKREEVFVDVSNDFTSCYLCSFEISFNGVSTEAGVFNSSLVSAYAPVVSSPFVVAVLMIHYKQFNVETTNSISIPLMAPSINSYMIAKSGVAYLLSLFGENFGFEKAYLTVSIVSQNSTEINSCSIQTVNDDFVSCLTTIGSGTVYVTRSSKQSNQLKYTIQEMIFSVDDYVTEIDDYLQYPSLFHTVGGDVFEVFGHNIPSSCTVSFGSERCLLNHINSTHISCLVPPGEGIHIPVRIHYQQQILLQVFASYYAPVISIVNPSTLQYDTEVITLEGSDFGLNPVVDIRGIASGAINCTSMSHSHSWIQCELRKSDRIGLIIAVSVNGQMSNSVSIPIASPRIDTISVSDINGSILDGIPTGGEARVHLHGENLDSESTQCLMNGIQLVILFHNSTDVICVTEESFNDEASFMINTGFYTTNTVVYPYLSPVILTMTPSIGRTNGGERILLIGENFGCSMNKHVSYMRILFGTEMIPHSSILFCNHTHIQFIHPPGQGLAIPVTIERFNQTSAFSSTPFFDYLAPQISFITSASTWPSNPSASFGSELQIEQYVLTLHGDNFGIKDTDVLVSGEECALIQQNHTMIRCISPLFFGGSHDVQILVSTQKSNVVSVEFPLIQITSANPLTVESVGASIHFYGLHIPPATRISMSLLVGSVNVTDCHISLSSFSADHFIECHLPILPRGQWPLTLTVGSMNVPIPLLYSMLTVVCPSNYYASTGDYCSLCPSDSLCPANSTTPIAPPGSWVTISTDGSKKPSVDICFNPKACLGGNQCQEGYTSNKCSQCKTHYTRYGTWTCKKCPIGISRVFPLILWVIVCFMLFLASISRYSTHFIWYAVLIDVFQLLGLLSIFRDQFSSLLSPLLDFFSMFILDMDMFKLDCVFVSMNESVVWIISLTTLFLCCVITVVVQWITQYRRKKHLTSTDFGNSITQLTQLLYVLILPILFHSLQSLSCNNKYYMAHKSIQFSGLKVCYSYSDYWWILITSSIILLLVFGFLTLSAHFAQQEISFFASFHGVLTQTLIDSLDDSLRPSMRFLGHLFKNESLWSIFIVFIIKIVLVVMLVLFREEPHMQSVLILSMIVVLVLYLLLRPPFKIHHQYITSVFTRTTLNPLSVSKEKDSCFVKSLMSRKRFPFDVNNLLVMGLLLFAILFADISLSPSVYSSFTPVSSSSWRVVCDIVIVVLLCVFMLCDIASGCGEILSKIRKSPIAFFDIIQAEKSVLVDETVVVNAVLLNSEERVLKDDYLNRLHSCITHNLPVSAIQAQENTVSLDHNVRDLFRLSYAEILLNGDVQHILQNEGDEANLEMSQEEVSSKDEEMNPDMLNEIITVFQKRLEEKDKSL